MQFKTSLLVALLASATLLLPACSSAPPPMGAPTGGAPMGGAPVGGAPTTGASMGAGTPAAASVTDPRGNGQRDTAVYRKRGMEISAITARMADSLQQSMFYYLLPNSPTSSATANPNVKIVTMPRLAVTSFVDTDTYENAGYLGRALAEFFTNEMTNRAFEVTEYKLTGSLAVARDGDYMLSRNWRKIARDTKVRHLLGGTLTRNANGVVLVARIIDMQSRQVIAAATDFIPYELLPSCYRTASKQCEFGGQNSYLGVQQIRDANYYKTRYEQTAARLAALESGIRQAEAQTRQHLTKATVRSASGQPLGGVFVTNVRAPYSVGTMVNTNPAAANNPAVASSMAATVPAAPVAAGATPGAPVVVGTTVNTNANDYYIPGDPRFAKDVIRGATSRGNYDRFRFDRDNSSIFGACGIGGCDNPVVYPANTYMHNTMLVRDTADESAYDRTR